jgi:hydrogenase maturation protein HypF
MNQRTTLKIQIEGIVQGVGFRPFIYNLAKTYSLSGYVLNNSNGVEIIIQGNEYLTNMFVQDIKTKSPRLSVITSLKYEKLTDALIYNNFSIKESVALIDRTALISPDISICDKCLHELFDTDNRRYKYPFINCTDCGPRYTIIENIPYDRPLTSMKSFEMCDKCRDEYGNPSDRRFHAQPDACFICGPQIALYKSEGRAIYGFQDNIFASEKMIAFNRERTELIINETIKMLKKGNIIAIKGLGGFHLAVDAENDEAVKKLRTRKNRYEKPLALMALNMEKISSFTRVRPEDELLLGSIQRPIVLLKKKENKLISANVAPNSDNFGVMLPYTPLHYLLLHDNFLALIMTSGNYSDEPICKDNEEAMNVLRDIADYFLIHNREIHFRCDDSVVKNIFPAGFDSKDPSGKEDNTEDNFSRIIIRRSRGYVPTPVFLKDEQPAVLALGAELKNTICLTKNKYAFLSQHIGDLENLETLDYFEETIKHFRNILQVSPDIIAYDMHPEYLNTKWLLGSELSSEKEIVPVQHHHAHIAACLAENMQNDTVIGFAMDGTGFGTDNNIWGGEILICDFKGFERYSHFEYIPLPGGDLAVREPWRIGIGFLYQNLGDQLFDLDIPFIKNLQKDRILTICQMIKRNFNTFNTSSLGRLFDVLSAIATEKNKVSYEGQAAVEFENYLYDVKDIDHLNGYKFHLDENGIIKNDLMLKSVIFDLLRKTEPSVISYKFHAGITKILTEIAVKIREERGINKTALSGGCFQNSFLLGSLVKNLRELKFEVFTHRLTPSNDGGISLGQAVIAGNKL